MCGGLHRLYVVDRIHHPIQLFRLRQIVVVGTQVVRLDFVFFFFQAEDGIRDHCVTGVQTCALPISARGPPCAPARGACGGRRGGSGAAGGSRPSSGGGRGARRASRGWASRRRPARRARSEERRVGKECRSLWSASTEKKKIERKKHT